jgi:hypothetical protein
MMTKPTKLLPCPFCGQAGLLVNGEVYCGCCNIKLLLENWNIRSTPIVWAVYSGDAMKYEVVMNKVEYVQDGIKVDN